MVFELQRDWVSIQRRKMALATVRRWGSQRRLEQGSRPVKTGAWIRGADQEEEEKWEDFRAQGGRDSASVPEHLWDVCGRQDPP